LPLSSKIISREETDNYIININPYNIEIIDRADTKSKLELKEELHIVAKKPELNTQHVAAYKRIHKKTLSRSVSKH